MSDRSISKHLQCISREGCNTPVTCQEAGCCQRLNRASDQRTRAPSADQASTQRVGSAVAAGGSFSSKQIAIRHSQFVRRYLLRQGCEFAQTADEIGLFEVATFLESLPDETTARVSSEDCPVPEQEYIANMLESSAMWLQGKSTTVWAEEFGHTALMQSYAKFLRDLRQKLGSVQETKPDPTVRCLCGWQGKVSELVKLDSRHECPACMAEFRPIDTLNRLPVKASPKSFWSKLDDLRAQQDAAPCLCGRGKDFHPWRFCSEYKPAQKASGQLCDCGEFCKASLELSFNPKCRRLAKGLPVNGKGDV